MNVISRQGREDLAWLYIGQLQEGALIEFVESLQPPLPRVRKWVLIVSTLKGCPVRCQMCDAGGYYVGALSAEEILAQIDYMVTARFPDRCVPIPKFKIQFARMGEPALNPSVLDVLQGLPARYLAPGLMPCLSSVLPKRCESFFEQLGYLKDALFPRGAFQLQFSLHTTDEQKRRELILYPVLSYQEAARLGACFYRPGDRKIGLNFAAAQGYPINPQVLLSHFNPSIFAVKLTPLNPTNRGRINHLQTQIDPQTGQGAEDLIAALKTAGYDVIISLGESDEDAIGSNCGQFVSRYLEAQRRIAV